MDNKSLAVLKGLALNIMENSRCEHVGSSLSAAPILYTLYTKHIKVNPSVYDWVNRDRFIMSKTDMSPLLYAMLFLSGYQFNIEDLKNYGKLNSKTPINPEIMIPGIDANSGGRALGLATAVGLALSERILSDKFNLKPINKFDKKTKKLIDYYTYVLVTDGDLMEGLSYEAASIAGNLKLGKLIVLYDSNKLTMDSSTDKVFTESVSSRFASLGWHVQTVKNGNSISEINKSIIKAKKNMSAPSLIIINTKISEITLLDNQKMEHLSELTVDEFSKIKKSLDIGGLPFTLLKEPAENIRNQVVQRGLSLYDEWEKTYTEYKTKMNMESIYEFENLLPNNLNIDLTKINFNINVNEKETLRESNSKVMNIISNNIWNYIGGSADEGINTLTYLKDKGDISSNNFTGKNILFGARENAMGAISNGLALSGFRPFASTLLAFSEYMRPSIRMSALMDLPVTYIFTHDSITHVSGGNIEQPVEQLSSLRSIPNVYVYRPADIKEIIGTWQCILNDKKTAVISLAKTEVKPQNGTNILSVSKGAYIVSDTFEKIDAIIIATGAEVQVANSIKERLKSEGIDIRIVSMPCMEKYLEQTDDYKESVLPSYSKIFILEYGSSFGWEKFVSSSEYLFTIDVFGKSATKDEILKYNNLDIDSIIERIKSLI